MSKPRQPPRRRRSRPAHSEPPRNRLAEIQAEIWEVQTRIEDSRRARRLIRNAAELTVLEQEITRLTDRLAKLLIAETLQQAADDQQIDQQARSRFQGAGPTQEPGQARCHDPNAARIADHSCHLLQPELRSIAGAQRALSGLVGLGRSRWLYPGIGFRSQQVGRHPGLAGRGRTTP